MNRRARLLVYAAAMAVLAGVFTLYLQPEFMMNMADQLWSCF
jgi:hypothetical protein